ncbi:hypothetical protein ABPG72_003620 [Tetrahymena utriculariae]
MSQSLLNNSISTNGGLQIIKASGEYFCAQCLLQFQNDKEYKVHYKSELHLYNIKRRMLDLIPATPEQFELKKKQIIEQQKKTIVSAKSGVQLTDDFNCVPCNKSFNTESTFKAHVISKKHKENEKLYQQKKQNQSTTTTTKEAPKAPTVTTDKDQTVCLFCDKKSDDIQKNIEHMNKAHSFFISEEKYCVDKKGLLKHLGLKINITYLCILCENKGCKQFITSEAVKMHMMDKGHCFMQSTVFDEYADFYDFTPQIEEAVEYQKTLKQNNHLHEKVIELVQNKKDGDNEEDCEEWESYIDSNQSDYEDADEDEEQEESSKHNVKNTIKEQEEDEDEIQLENKPTKAKKQNNDEEWEDENEEGENDESKKKEKLKQQKKYRIHRIKVAKATLNERGELELPNGKTLGHRSFKHIYKQYYRPISNYASRMKAILGEDGYRQRQLVLATQNFQIQLMKKYDAIKSHKEEKNLLAYQMHRNKVNYVNVGISHNKLQHHFVQQCPL